MITNFNDSSVLVSARGHVAISANAVTSRQVAKLLVSCLIQPNFSALRQDMM